jgi:branched-chain amino acid aminotransferase
MQKKKSWISLKDYLKRLMQEPICFFNGKFLPKSQVHLSIDDLGFSRGYALFEHCRTYARKIFHLKEHLIRLYEGGLALNLPIPYTEKEWIDICEELVKLNDYEEVGIKIYVTLGSASTGYLPSTPPTVICNPYPLKRTNFSDPFLCYSIRTTTLQRSFPFCKTTFYIPGILARSKMEDCDEILFLDAYNNILESTIFSFLAFKGSTLIVPEGNLLKSITQEVLVMLAKQDFDVERRPISYHELSTLTAPFLAASSKEIVPIGSIDRWTYSPENHKPLFHLRALLDQYVQKSQWPLLEAFDQKIYAV